MLANEIVVGTIIDGFGRVDSLQVNHSQVAVRDSTPGVNIRGRAANALLRQELAKEAVEGLYRSIPVSVTVFSGLRQRTFRLLDSVKALRVAA